MVIVMIVTLIMSVGIVAIVMESVQNMQKRTLAHRERMKELEVEKYRLELMAAGQLPSTGALPAADHPYLPQPSDTLIRRGGSHSVGFQGERS